MLCFFAFPDAVERISSSREKLKILKGFNVPAANSWSQRKLDEELLALRKRLDGEYAGQALDFYRTPLVSRWKPAKENDFLLNEAAAEVPVTPQAPALPVSPINLILYGPPGTGKTYALQQLQASYTEVAQVQDRNAWLESLVAKYEWRAVIAAVLEKLGPTAVPEIRDHELIRAKARRQQVDKNVGQQIWGTLQRHTPESVQTVQIKSRAEPFIFMKSANSIWSLLPDWQSMDDKVAQLANLLTGLNFSSHPES